MMRRLLYLMMVVALAACSGHDDDNYSKKLSLSTEEFVWNEAQREAVLEISTNADWTITSNTDWCVPLMQKGSGRTTVPLWVTPNLTKSERTGLLTVKSNGISKTVSLRQPAMPSADDYQYVVPVVFHVLYKDQKDTLQYVRKGWLGKVMANVNRLYKHNSANVQFEMVKYDDEGNKLEEPGVVRHEVTFTDYDPNDFLDTEGKDRQQYSAYAFNIQRCINIYVFQFKDPKTMGLSDLAVTPENHKLDSLQSTDYLNTLTHPDFPFGCCINNTYIYETQDNGYYNPCFIVSTIAHELGHFLGLLHTFSEDECNEDDACTDTKNCDFNAYTSLLEALVASAERTGRTLTLDMVSERINCEDATTYIARNVMDYAYCYSDELTEQQKTRMKHVLNYCPSVPGPKLDIYKKTRAAGHTASPFRPRLSDCPEMPLKPASGKKVMPAKRR